MMEVRIRLRAIKLITDREWGCKNNLITGQAPPVLMEDSYFLCIAD